MTTRHRKKISGTHREWKSFWFSYRWMFARKGIRIECKTSETEIRIPRRHLYVLVLIQLFLDDDVSFGIVTYLINQMNKWETVWVSLDIIFVPLPIQTIQGHFATQLIQRFDGSTVIANHVIEIVKVNVCVGIQITIILKTDWKANHNFHLYMKKGSLFKWRRI